MIEHLFFIYLNYFLRIIILFYLIMSYLYRIYVRASQIYTNKKRMEEGNKRQKKKKEMKPIESKEKQRN